MVNPFTWLWRYWMSWRHPEICWVHMEEKRRVGRLHCMACDTEDFDRRTNERERILGKYNIKRNPRD